MASFAVVVPTFNRAHLLAETLDSLLGQSRPFEQVIVVDDGSTDNTGALVQSAYPGCTYCWQPNGERQRARNTGADAADTDWIVFCDSDDLLVAGYLTQVETLIAAHPQLDIVYCNNGSFGPLNRVNVSTFDRAPAGYWHGIADAGFAYIAESGALPVRLLRFQGLWPTGMAIRRSFFTAIGGWDERMAGIRCEDLEFTLRATACGRVGVLKAPLARIRRHEGHKSISRMRQSLGELQALQFCLAHHAAAAEPGLRSALTERIRRQRHTCFYEAFSSGRWDVARHFARSLRHDRLTFRERLKLIVLRMPDFATGIVFRLRGTVEAKISLCTGAAPAPTCLPRSLMEFDPPGSFAGTPPTMTGREHEKPVATRHRERGYGRRPGRRSAAHAELPPWHLDRVV
jgi:GT2 family glycosyltransferase